MIAASTGGPRALAWLLPRLTRALRVPILVVQHMTEGLEEAFAARLDGACGAPVSIPRSGQLVRQGHVWIAPSWGHMEVDTGKLGAPRLRIVKDAPVAGFRPAADRLFATAAARYGAHTLGIVLTGMGRDGTRGAREIRARGGRVLAESRDSATIWGMPGSVVEAGLAERVLHLQDIPGAVRVACAPRDLRAA